MRYVFHLDIHNFFSPNKYHWELDLANRRVP